MEASATRDGGSGAGDGSTFGEAIPLPRGPHHLSESQIAQSQRIRLMTAITELLAEKGWPGVTIGDIVGRAGVSRSAFYDHFSDKEDCLLEAYDVFGIKLLTAATASIDTSLPWDEFAGNALLAYLTAIQVDPVAGRAFMVEMDSAGPRARQRRREGINAFAAAMKEGHRVAQERDDSLAPLPDRVYLGVALGVRELIRDELERDPEADLTEMSDDVLAWVTAMIRGAT